MHRVPKEKEELDEHSSYSNEQYRRRQQDTQADVFEPDLPYEIRGRDQGPKMVFSNFILTISTNVVPTSAAEEAAAHQWLMDECNNLFDSWATLNGGVLKPAGTPNAQRAAFPDNHFIEGVRSRVTLERGDVRGQAHAHVVLEVAHRYHGGNGGIQGVHVNATAIREYLNSRIHLMEVDNLPNSIYVNARLLSRASDQQKKWLALQYIGKDRDAVGRDLAAMRRAGTAEERNIEQGLLQPDAEFNPLVNPVADYDGGLGGALIDDNGIPEFAQQSSQSSQSSQPSEDESSAMSSEWDNRPLRAVWVPAARKQWKKNSKR